MGGAIQAKMSTEDLIAYIKKNPGLTAWQLSQRLRMSAANLSSRLKRLTDDGKITRQQINHDSGPKGWTYYGV